MLVGLYVACNSFTAVKKLMGLSIFQLAIILFYISFGFIYDSCVPILSENARLYTNPLPQVLMLTAIVVGVATLSVGLALAIKIDEKERK